MKGVTTRCSVKDTCYMYETIDEWVDWITDHEVMLEEKPRDTHILIAIVHIDNSVWFIISAKCSKKPHAYRDQYLLAGRPSRETIHAMVVVKIDVWSLWIEHRRTIKKAIHSD